VSRMRKAVVAFIGLAVEVALFAETSGVVSTNSKWVAFGVGVVTLLGVYHAPNTPPTPPVA